METAEPDILNGMRWDVEEEDEEFDYVEMFDYDLEDEIFDELLEQNMTNPIDMAFLTECQEKGVEAISTGKRETIGKFLHKRNANKVFQIENAIKSLESTDEEEKAVVQMVLNAMASSGSVPIERKTVSIDCQDVELAGCVKIDDLLRRGEQLERIAMSTLDSNHARLKSEGLFAYRPFFPPKVFSPYYSSKGETGYLSGAQAGIVEVGNGDSKLKIVCTLSKTYNKECYIKAFHVIENAFDSFYHSQDDSKLKCMLVDQTYIFPSEHVTSFVEMCPHPLQCGEFCDCGQRISSEKYNFVAVMDANLRKRLNLREKGYRLSPEQKSMIYKIQNLGKKQRKCPRFYTGNLNLSIPFPLMVHIYSTEVTNNAATVNDGGRTKAESLVVKYNNLSKEEIYAEQERIESNKNIPQDEKILHMLCASKALFSRISFCEICQDFFDLDKNNHQDEQKHIQNSAKTHVAKKAARNGMPIFEREAAKEVQGKTTASNKEFIEAPSFTEEQFDLMCLMNGQKKRNCKHCKRTAYVVEPGTSNLGMMCCCYECSKDANVTDMHKRTNGRGARARKKRNQDLLDQAMLVING